MGVPTGDAGSAGSYVINLLFLAMQDIGRFCFHIFLYFDYPILINILNISFV